MEDIIIRGCTNQTLTQHEKAELNRWLSESAKNRKLYAQLYLTLVGPDSQKSLGIKMDIKKRLTTQIANDTKEERRKRISFFMRHGKMAAAIMIMLGLVITIIQLQKNQATSTTKVIEVKMIEKVSLPGQKISTVLPDGTVVKLNSGSKIIVPENFTKNQRKVKLHGEAFFNVKRDVSRPFIVESNHSIIEVLGTSFNVRDYEEETNKSIVAVKSGKVLLSNHVGDKIILNELEFTDIVEGNDLAVQKIDNPDDLFGWTDQLMVFKNHPLTDVFTKIERWFGVHISVHKHIDSTKKYTTTYDNPSIKEVLETLSHVYNFNYEITNKNHVIIK